MANLKVLDGDGDPKFLKATGVGSDGDPLILDRTTTVSGTVNVADGGGSLTVDGSVTVVDGGGSLTVDGTVAATQSGTWNVGTVTTVTNPVSVTDNGGSLTVDGTVAATQSGAWNVGVVEKTMSYATGTVATSGDNTLVATPGAGNRLVVTLFIIQNESTTATTMILKSGSTNRFRLLAQSQGDGLSTVFPVGQAWKLAENEPLVLNLSGANSCGYSIQHYTEAV